MNINNNNNENLHDDKCYEENEEEINNKHLEEIQWEDIDAKELKDIKVSFQAIPKKLVELKIENANIDFLANNDNDEIHDNLEKNLEAIFDIDSKKDNSVCNKTIQTEDKEINLNTSNNNQDEKLFLDNTNEDSKKDKFSLFSDLSLFNRNNNNVQTDINYNLNNQVTLQEIEKNTQEEKNVCLNNITNTQNNFENAKIFENVCYLENPIALIKKNLFSKNWFVTKNDKLIQCFNSYELFKYLENEINKKKGISTLWVFDHETDIHFTASAIYDNLKDNINDLMKELQTNYQQNIIKKQMFLNSIPPNMMFNPRSPNSNEIGKLPVIPSTNVPLFQPFPPQMPPINHRFMPPPMFMPIPGNFMMNFSINNNMNLKREKIEDQINSNNLSSSPKTELNQNTMKIGK